jgi:outer membrane protein OmpA-like peptidoglycan-associated protein
VITVKKEDIAFNTQIIRAAELPASMEPATVDLKVQEAQTGSSFVMENILYRTASADLQEESHIILENFAAYLKEHPTFDVEIQGHTDNVGNAKDNEALSSNRAFTVKALLETYGIDGKRITAKGYGQSAPLADNTTEAGRAKNRRTAFVLK